MPETSFSTDDVRVAERFVALRLTLSTMHLIKTPDHEGFVDQVGDTFQKLYAKVTGAKAD